MQGRGLPCTPYRSVVPLLLSTHGRNRLTLVLSFPLSKTPPMIFHYDHANGQRASELRKNMTGQERRLWYGFLSSYPVRFRRQKRFGSYIVDFYCPGARLAVELDGSQHFTDAARQYDEARTAFLGSLGIDVLRIPNNDVDERFHDVCVWIDDTVSTRMRGRK